MLGGGYAGGQDPYYGGDGGIPRSIILQGGAQPDQDGPNVVTIENEVDQRELKRYLQACLSDELRGDPRVGAAAAENQRLLKLVEERAKEAARRAATDVAGKKAEEAAIAAYVERQTLLPPKENLTLNDVNLQKAFIRTPGIGPILLLTMIGFYGGLAEEESAPSEENTEKESKRSVRGIYKALAAQSKDEDSFLNTAKTIASSTKCFGCNPDQDSTDSADADTPEISTPWHVALLPMSMLCTQFSYLFFIFNEAWKGYSGGTCPGYNVTTIKQNDYPIGAGTETRILIAFIAAFFVVRVAQQLLLFLHALEGQYTDQKQNKDKKQLFLGFAPIGFEDKAAMMKDTIKLIEEAERRLQHLGPATIRAPVQIKQNIISANPNSVEIHIPAIPWDGKPHPNEKNPVSPQNPNVPRLMPFEKNLLSCCRNIRENIWNLAGVYGEDFVSGVKDQLKRLTKGFEENNYLPPQSWEQLEKEFDDRHNILKVQAKRRDADKLPWRNIKWSWLFPAFIADCAIQLILTIFVFLLNLYIVFIDGVSSRDMVLNVVLLDFIYEQLPKFKQAVFKSEKAKALVRTLRIAHHDPPVRVWWKYICRGFKKVGLQVIMYVCTVALLICIAVVIYGPICKPGPNTAGTTPAVNHK